MAPRTSQLQVRVSPEQKATLKRLAAHAGLSVSAYVLAQALPSARGALEGGVTDLRDGKPGALAVLRQKLEAIPRAELGERVESVDVSALDPLAQNQLAALVEDVARVARVEAPRWTTTVQPLEHPQFRWLLRSLRPYQLRASPVALKRRNVFDPSRTEHPPAPAALQQLQDLLTELQLDLEFYFVQHALLYQTFPAYPATVHPAAMFADPEPLLQALPGRTSEGLGPGAWPEAALRETVRSRVPGQGYLDVARLQAFTPPLGYALAIKTAAGALGGPRRADDVRFLLRAMNLSTPDAAMTVVTRYLAERQLPADTREFLGRVLES